NFVKASTLATCVKCTETFFSCPIPTNIGPPSNAYFIKFYNNDTNNPYAAYSHTFSIQNVNGSVQGFDPNNPSQPGTTDSASNTTQ
ncbi:11199_t:CDS:2, partial [Gigaspora rosea]